MGGGRFEEFGETADDGHRPGQETGEPKEIPVKAGNVRWERPTTRSFWNALADPEREALAAAGGGTDLSRRVGTVPGRR